MPGYIIAQIKVNDPEPYKEYVTKNTELVEKFGGRFLVRGGNPEILEGEVAIQRTIILEFPSADDARRWYESPEYAEIKSIRLATADSTLVLLEGA
jgi:uncharacterized protein (DUF1330 family)